MDKHSYSTVPQSEDDGGNVQCSSSETAVNGEELSGGDEAVSLRAWQADLDEMSKIVTSLAAMTPQQRCDIAFVTHIHEPLVLPPQQRNEECKHPPSNEVQSNSTPHLSGCDKSATSAVNDETSLTGTSVKHQQVSSNDSDQVGAGGGRSVSKQPVRRSQVRVVSVGGDSSSALTLFATHLASQVVLVSATGASPGEQQHVWAQSILNASAVRSVRLNTTSKAPPAPTTRSKFLSDSHCGEERAPCPVVWRARDEEGQLRSIPTPLVDNMSVDGRSVSSARPPVRHRLLADPRDELPPATPLAGILNWDDVYVAASNGARRGITLPQWRGMVQGDRVLAYAMGVREWASATASRTRCARQQEVGLGPAPFLPDFIVASAWTLVDRRRRRKDGRVVAAVTVATGVTTGVLGGLWKGAWVGMTTGGPVGAVTGAVLGAAGAALLGAVGVGIKRKMEKKLTL